MKGVWKCHSGELIITDPGFGKISASEGNSVWMLGKRVCNAKQGMWTTKLIVGDILDWGERVKCMVSFTDGEANGESETFSLGVDSGQMSVFDWSYFPEGECDESFYESCCDTTNNDFGGTVAGRGFVSRAGIGDGMYDVKVTRNLEGQAVRIEVNFVHDALPSMAQLQGH